MSKQRQSKVQRATQIIPTSVFLWRCLGELVKDVEVSLIRNLSDNPRFFEEIVGDVGTHWLANGVKLELEVLSESRRVVVTQGFRITE